MFRAAVLEEVTNNKNICSAVLLTFVFAMHSESQSQCGFLLSLLQRRKPIAAAAAHDILCVCVIVEWGRWGNVCRNDWITITITLALNVAVRFDCISNRYVCCFFLFYVDCCCCIFFCPCCCVAEATLSLFFQFILNKLYWFFFIDNDDNDRRRLCLNGCLWV